MIKIRFAGKFWQDYKELLSDSPNLETIFDSRIGLFRVNHNDTRLNNHALTKRLEGKWALNITDDVRVVYEWVGKRTARFLLIGGHKKVYQKQTTI